MVVDDEAEALAGRVVLVAPGGKLHREQLISIVLELSRAKVVDVALVPAPGDRATAGLRGRVAVGADEDAVAVVSEVADRLFLRLSADGASVECAAGFG